MIKQKIEHTCALIAYVADRRVDEDTMFFGPTDLACLYEALQSHLAALKNQAGALPMQISSALRLELA
jgi:hypothetical protein